MRGQRASSGSTTSASPACTGCSHEHDASRRAEVVIVVAGMEGALPSVVGGLVARPVIAVPTSVGYGASFGGFAALLAMLNACARGHRGGEHRQRLRRRGGRRADPARGRRADRRPAMTTRSPLADPASCGRSVPSRVGSVASYVWQSRSSRFARSMRPAGASRDSRAQRRADGRELGRASRRVHQARADALDA